MSDNPLQKSAQLADHEQKQVAKRREEISKVVQKIEDLLVESNCTWQEWHNIIQMFNERNEIVIPKITIKEIKQRYNDQSK
jgi:hypothetical protein